MVTALLHTAVLYLIYPPLHINKTLVQITSGECAINSTLPAIKKQINLLFVPAPSLELSSKMHTLMHKQWPR